MIVSNICICWSAYLWPPQNTLDVMNRAILISNHWNCKTGCDWLTELRVSGSCNTDLHWRQPSWNVSKFRKIMYYVYETNKPHSSALKNQIAFQQILLFFFVASYFLCRRLWVEIKTKQIYVNLPFNNSQHLLLTNGNEFIIWMSFES